MIAAMGLKTTKNKHSSKPLNTSIRDLATNFVAARFDAGSNAAIPSRSASRIAGFSTVTASGATAAGLDRCAYTLGKWQNNIQAAPGKKARKHEPEQISSHFPDIVKRAGSNSNLKTLSAAESVVTESARHSTDNTSANEKTALVVRFDRMESRSKNRQSDKHSSSNEVAQLRERAQPRVATAAMATAATVPASNTTITTIGKSNYTGEERRVAADRREFTLQTLWHCLKNPRRASGRRRSDKRYPLLDVFDGGAMFLAVALITLSLCDAFFTLNIIAQGGQEVNPIMNHMLNYGTFAFVASKMMLTALAVVVMTAAGNLKIFGLVRVRSVIALLIGLYAGLIVYELLILAMI